MSNGLMAKLAGDNFKCLGMNSYPGRGIVAGLDETGDFLVQVYWIMGRSENSRNRVFVADNNTGRLYTEAADPSLVEDPSLIIYNAMREEVSFYVVSNGDQTDTVIERLQDGGPFYLGQALSHRSYEPDAPNFTPRITALSRLSKGGSQLIEITVLRKSPFGDRWCDRLDYTLDPGPGFGYCVTTYASDGDPLPPFRGEPLVMSLQGGPEEIAQAYWAVLNKKNRVALAVKWIEKLNGRSDIYVINK